MTEHTEHRTAAQQYDEAFPGDYDSATGLTADARHAADPEDLQAALDCRRYYPCDHPRSSEVLRELAERDARAVEIGERTKRMAAVLTMSPEAWTVAADAMPPKARAHVAQLFRGEGLPVPAEFYEADPR